jgi:hypothetical protein
MPNKEEASFPSLKDIDTMTVFPVSGSECTVLCHDLLGAIEELQDATGIKRLRLLARIRAIRSQMQHLKCHPCLPE